MEIMRAFLMKARGGKRRIESWNGAVNLTGAYNCKLQTNRESDQRSANPSSSFLPAY
jgi:hypothetical protein